MKEKDECGSVNQTKPIPTPWCVRWFDNDPPQIATMADADGFGVPVATVEFNSRLQQRANAVFIVDACNSHDGFKAEICRLTAQRDALLAVIEPLARSVCLDQRNGQTCICFSCEAKRALALCEKAGAK
jgi:hypothetical protein